MSATKEYLPLESLGGVIKWPDVVVCAPRWSGRGQPMEKREYLPVVHCKDCVYSFIYDSSELFDGDHSHDRRLCVGLSESTAIDVADDFFCAKGEREDT